MTLSLEGGDGIVKDGGTNSHTFAKDGESSSSGQHPTWAFASFVHMALQLQKCWHIHPTSLSSLITLTNIRTSEQQMKRR
jgi:hypothetical protein